MDSLSFKVLEIFSSRRSLTLSQLSAILNIDWMNLSEPVNRLRSLSYLRFEPNHAVMEGLTKDSPLSVDSPLVISFEGRAALEQELKERKQFKYTEFRAWLTLAVAVVALIVSVIALVQG